ncbi:Phosphotransferase enzyme family protein [Thermomonospora echinospora]|uniref:Phosphotransferase enzyme family protein n=1 Tax=Thermomonospora echinospora TaxID=1992 RepID=A0A1H6CMU9_9ACTN|nr:phosphotransferase [Thermomonospora echinospora]SEG74379.1 Phosphotransferase enzyme family protein [Thermomonospora echinospora]
MTRTTTDRITWADLPRVVRDQVRERTGRVTGSRPAGGDRSDITATLDTATGPVFIKGAHGGVFARSLNNEARVSPHVAGIAPGLLWRFEVDGWTVLGFEYIEGRHADYSPGSADLGLLHTAVSHLQTIPVPEVVTRGAERHYGGLDVLTGGNLLHTDLHPENVLITPRRAYIVDWAWACKGAAWAEPAMLAFRLMAAGHTVESAEAWGRSFPSWTDGRPLAAFVAANARVWERAAQQDPQEWKIRAAALARQWADYHRPEAGRM